MLFLIVISLAFTSSIYLVYGSKFPNLLNSVLTSFIYGFPRSHFTNIKLRSRNTPKSFNALSLFIPSKGFKKIVFSYCNVFLSGSESTTTTLLSGLFKYFKSRIYLPLSNTNDSLPKQPAKI